MMIFCLEDDGSIRELMMYTIRSSGFEVRGFPNASEFREALKEEMPQLVMLDIMLPDEDGISVLKWLRSAPETRDIPVIMATAKGTEFDKVTGLDTGADDYLVKPFGMIEMLSRIRAVLRRSGRQGDSSVLTCGSIELNETSHMVSEGGKIVELTLKEFELLSLFMKNPGRVFTREQMLSSVWGETYMGETRTVDVHIATLRTKLGDSGKHIKTVRGVGYRLEVTS